MFPSPLTRRRFLQTAGCGFGATAFASLLARDLGAAPAAVAYDPAHPMSPRPPMIAPRAKHVIFLYLVGGPGSIDTFAYKPLLEQLAGKPIPQSFRDRLANSEHPNLLHDSVDQLVPSPWKFRQYGERGTWVSDLFPCVGQHADDLCFVHSMQAASNNHAPASIQLHTGDMNGGKASLGSWVTYGLGSDNQDLPAYVLLFEAGPMGGTPNYSPGFLPAAFQGTRLRAANPPVQDLLPSERFASSQRASLDALERLNSLHRAERQGNSELDARLASYELAYRMQSSALEVADLEREPSSVQRMYGIDSANDLEAKFARKCLLARRLVERGVRFVQLYDMTDHNGWDAHARLKENHERCAAAVDRPIAALLADLKQTGLWDDTLVICSSEFGRTPNLQGKDGRQHNAAGFTLWMAGGAVRPGLHYGATDDLGLMAVENPVPFRDLHATILHALGLDHQALYYEVSGRLERLTGVENLARVVPELLA